jgi:hypothetical protein
MSQAYQWVVECLRTSLGHDEHVFAGCWLPSDHRRVHPPHHNRDWRTLGSERTRCIRRPRRRAWISHLAAANGLPDSTCHLCGYELLARRCVEARSSQTCSSDWVESLTPSTSFSSISAVSRRFVHKSVHKWRGTCRRSAGRRDRAQCLAWQARPHAGETPQDVQQA